MLYEQRVVTITAEIVHVSHDPSVRWRRYFRGVSFLLTVAFGIYASLAGCKFAIEKHFLSQSTTQVGRRVISIQVDDNEVQQFYHTSEGSLKLDIQVSRRERLNDTSFQKVPKESVTSAPGIRVFVEGIHVN